MAQEHDPAPGKETSLLGFTFRSASWDEEKPHLWTYFSKRAHPPTQRRGRSLRPHAALACHLANESYFRKAATTWDGEKIKLTAAQPFLAVRRTFNHCRTGCGASLSAPSVKSS